ncbi:MAG: ribonuclease Z [Lachnospiraceae bacterium]|nr:ribonuclease Z [Lachnospiraceae bacterium]
MIDVCLLGTGGMMPLPYRYLTSLMTRIEGHQLLIDCGEGTQIAAKKAGWSTYPVDVICFTHYHADHISGLPGFLLSMGNADRTEPLTLIGPKGLERVVSALRVIAPELPFEIRFRELTEKRETIDLGFVTLEAFRVNHNITCYGYSLVLRRAGKFDADRAKELGLPVQLWGRLQKGETVEYEGAVYTSDMVMGAERRGIKLTYCTDTRPSSGVSAAAAGADLFICEGMYGEREKDKKAREYKHMTMYDAAKLAKDAGAGELWLTHYSPSMNRPGDYIDAVQEIFPQAVCGKDGMSTTLRFRD